MKNTDNSKKHHYVPQAFIKAWANNDNEVHWYDKNSVQEWRVSKINTIFYKKNLYSLLSSVEQAFITPFIDQKFFSALVSLRNKSWKELSEIEKENVIRYLISLSARNPKAIESFKENSKKYFQIINMFKGEFIQLSGDLGVDIKEVEKGFENGILIFLGVMIDELNLGEELIKIKYNNHQKICKIWEFLINISKEFNTYRKSYSSFIIEALPELQIREFVIESNELISSTSPVLLEGINEKGLMNNKFHMLVNISPNKAFFITNNNVLASCYNLMNSQELVSFFNYEIGKNSSQIIKKIISK